MTSPYDWIDESLLDLDERQLRRRLVNRSGPQSATIQINDRWYLNFGSNDYLGLANHPQVRGEIGERVGDEGVGSGASPLILGHSQFHAELESKLAALEQTDAALVFSSGYAANIGTICARQWNRRDL